MLAEWTGLEPATPGVTGRYSNQLNYHSALQSPIFAGDHKRRIVAWAGSSEWATLATDYRHQIE